MNRKAAHLDPQLKEIEVIRENRRIPESQAVTPETARAQLEAVTADMTDRIETPGVDDIREFDIEGPNGPLPIRAYLPDNERAAPVVVFLHGGGFVYGSIDTHDNICRTLTDRLGSLVLSVEYGLAPENPFPGPVNEAYAATQWAARHAGDLGGDSARLVVMGDSAGGNLAAVVSRMARDSRAGTGYGMDGIAPAIDHQVLVYPWLDPAGRFEFDSYALRDASTLPNWLYEKYVRDDTDAWNSYFAPLLARDVSELPPATIVTAGFDPLRDEGFEYADRLEEAGVQTVLENYPAMNHGFVSLLGLVDQADEAMDLVVDELRTLA